MSLRLGQQVQQQSLCACECVYLCVYSKVYTMCMDVCMQREYARAIFHVLESNWARSEGP